MQRCRWARGPGCPHPGTSRSGGLHVLRAGRTGACPRARRPSRPRSLARSASTFPAGMPSPGSPTDTKKLPAVMRQASHSVGMRVDGSCERHLTLVYDPDAGVVGTGRCPRRPADRAPPPVAPASAPGRRSDRGTSGMLRSRPARVSRNRSSRRAGARSSAMRRSLAPIKSSVVGSPRMEARAAARYASSNSACWPKN